MRWEQVAEKRSKSFILSSDSYAQEKFAMLCEIKSSVPIRSECGLFYLKPPSYKDPPWTIGGTLVWALGGGLLFGHGTNKEGGHLFRGGGFTDLAGKVEASVRMSPCFLTKTAESSASWKYQHIGFENLIS